MAERYGVEEFFMKKNRKKILALTVCGILTVSLAACGPGRTEKTDQAMQKIETMEYEEALLILETALVGKEDPRMVARGKGIACLGLTRYEEAAAYFEEALTYSDEKPDPIDFDINYYLATAYYKQGRLDRAAAVYTAITDLKPKETDAFYLRGIVELEQGKVEAAGQDFDAAVLAEPGNYDLRIDIFRSCAEYGQEEMGAVYLQDVISEGNKKLTDFDRGRIHYYLGDYENARLELENAKESGGAEAVVLLGQTYEHLGDYNYAASVYSNYLETKGPDSDVYNKLGLCKMKSGDYEAALAAFQSAIELEGNVGVQMFKFNEIAAYEKMGQFSKAKLLMEQYLELYPDDDRARREYDFLQTR